jgi:hypothetical protein
MTQEAFWKNEVEVYLHHISLEIAAWKGDWNPTTHILRLTQSLIDLIHEHTPGMIDPETKQEALDAGWRGSLLGYRIKVQESRFNESKHKFERVHEQRSEARTSRDSQASIS